MVCFLGLAACQPSSVSDQLFITFGSGENSPPAQIDMDCETEDCDGSEVVGVEVTWGAASSAPEDATVELEQYRIDYYLPALGDEEVPYFAGVLSAVVPVGETVSFNVRAAGEPQREFVRARTDDPIDGVATITVAGYDHRNEIVQVSADFEVVFGDFSVETP